MMVIIGVIFYLFISIYFTSYIDDVVLRFQNDNVDQRSSAFQTVENLVRLFPLGVGNDYMEYIRKYHLYTFQFDPYFATFDNYFLSKIAMHGILCLPFIFFDYYYIFNLKKR